jgi:hypothetical protein
MSGSALAKKLKLKPNQRGVIINGPEGYADELDPLPDGVELGNHVNGTYDWVQLFVLNTDELATLLPQALDALKPEESMLLISFPKGSSKIQTDLTRDKGWDALRGVDLKWVSLVSVNDTWSAFAMRSYKPGEERTPVWS